MNTQFKVLVNGLVVDTVVSTTGETALREAIAKYGPEATVELDTGFDLPSMEGISDLRMMRSYAVKVFPNIDQHQINDWLCKTEIIIHNSFSDGEGFVVLYSVPAQTTVFKSVSEKALQNPNQTKEFFALLPDDSLYRLGYALGANWSQYPDRDQTRRNCMNSIHTALLSESIDKQQYPLPLIQACRKVLHTGVLTANDVNLIRAQECKGWSRGELLDHVSRLREEWGDQIEFLLELLKYFGINPEQKLKDYKS